MRQQMKKQVKHFLVLALLCMVAPQAGAAGEGRYLRLWRGFTKPTLTEPELYRQLPAFMRWTNALYGDELNNYLVAVSPSARPASVPSEVALLAFGDEAAYRRVRATPEGQRYGEAHWELFDRARSGSLVVERSPVIPAKLSFDHAYDFSSVSAGSNDWARGHSTFFIGLRKPGQTSEVFLARLRSHIALVRDSFLPFGLKGYVVVATPDYEMAIMSWESEAKMEEAFSSLFGRAVMSDGQEFLENLQWSGQERVGGAGVSPGTFYTTM